MREPEELNFLPCAELPTEKPIIPIYYIKITAMNCYQVGDKLRTDCFVPRSVVATLHFYDAKKKEEFIFAKNLYNTCVFEYKILDLDYYPGVLP